MNIADMARRAERVLANNSPALLTAVGVAGTLTTAYLTGKATIKATHLVCDERDVLLLPPTSSMNPKWVIAQTWKFYIPAASTAVITVAAIICANRIGSKRAAAVAAAYSLSEKAWAEYREKVIEKVGDKKEQTFRDELAQERVVKDPVSNHDVIVLTSEGVLCREDMTGRYFMSTLQILEKARNDTNYQILHQNEASLSDFYDRIGIDHTAMSDNVGWTSQGKQLELLISTALTEDSRPCLTLGYSVTPIRY